MGKYKSLIVLGTAMIIALITSVLIYAWLQKKTKFKEAAVLETQPVAVALVYLPWGTVLTPEVLKVVPFLKSSLPEGCFSDPAALVGRVLIAPVKAREPVFESRLAPTTIKTGGVAALINPRKRAVAVKVDKVIGVSGFIHPGNRVDVLVTISTAKNSNQIVTKTILENLLVLAVGAEVDKKGKEEKASPVDVITLEVAPEEAEKLALAATEGKLQLALRNFNDTLDITTQGMTVPTLLASYNSHPKKPPAVRSKGPARKSPLPPALPLPAPPPPVKVENKILPEKPPVLIVELIKGGKITEVKFEGSK